MLLPFIVAAFMILLGVGHAAYRKLVSLAECRYQAWGTRTEPRSAESPLALASLAEPVHYRQVDIDFGGGIWDGALRAEARCTLVAGSAWDYRTVPFGPTAPFKPHLSLLEKLVAGGWQAPDFSTVTSMLASLVGGLL